MGLRIDIEHPVLEAPPMDFRLCVTSYLQDDCGGSGDAIVLRQDNTVELYRLDHVLEPEGSPWVNAIPSQAWRNVGHFIERSKGVPPHPAVNQFIASIGLAEAHDTWPGLGD